MEFDLPTHLDRARKLTVFMDNKFRFLGFNFGLDPLLSIVPGIGSMFGFLTSAYLFYIAYKIHLPSRVFLNMLVNSAFDYVIGSIPVAGVIADAFYKSNQRNLRLLEKYIDSEKLM